VFAAPRKSNFQLTADSAVGHETAVVVERRLLGQRLAKQTCHFEVDVLSDG